MASSSERASESLQVRGVDPANLRWGMWVNGAEDQAPERKTALVRSPHDGRHLADVEQADDAATNAAILSAADAFVSNRGVPGHVRANWLHAAADSMSAAADTLTSTLVDTLGKPVRLSRTEVSRAPALLHSCAEEISRLGGETLPLDATAGGEGRWGLTRREPFGVVSAITPFNAPVNLLLQKVAPALAVGNSVVIKPAPEGAIAALQIAEILSQILPPGLINVVCGGPHVAQQLVRDPRVQAVTLTGGVRAGEAVLANAGIKPVLLELGSNSPNIVCASADLDDAATRIAAAAFGASGQQCISAQRVIIETQVFSEFEERFAEAARRLVVGDPSDPDTDLGPLIGESARQRVLHHIEDAERGGARLVLDGRAESLVFGPTILSDPAPDALLLREEVFGPVAVLIGADSLECAIDLANDSDLGLQAACFTRDLNTAMRAAERVRAGSVWINEATRFRLDTYPFGGYGRSGIGREGVRYAMEELSQLKFVGLRGVSR